MMGGLKVVEVRYARQSDARNFYGGDDPLMTFRGVVIDKDGEIIALGGVYREQQNMIAFSDFKPGALKYKKEIVKAANMAMDIVKEYREVFAIIMQDNFRSTSHSFITHYGFVEDPARPGVYVWRREKCR